MKSNYLFTLLSVFCLISCSDDDSTKPITLKDREGTTINLIYPNENKYSYSLEGGDGNYSVTSDNSKIATVEMISSTEFNVGAISIGEATIKITDNSQNTLTLKIIVNYQTDKFVVLKHDIKIIGKDLTESEKKAIEKKYLSEIPVKVGGGYRFIFTEIDENNSGNGKAIIYSDSYGNNGIETVFERERNGGIVEHILNYKIVINKEKRVFVFEKYYPSARAIAPVTMALMEDITQKVQKEYPKTELVITSQIISMPKE